MLKPLQIEYLLKIVPEDKPEVSEALKQSLKQFNRRELETDFLTFMRNARVYETEDYIFTYIDAINKVDVGYKGKQTTENKLIQVDNFTQITDWIEDEHLEELRECDECGCPFQEGVCYGSGDGYSCSDCFPLFMDSEYGVGNWKLNPDEYSAYVHLVKDKNGNWTGFDAYYTDWYGCLA